MVGLKKLTDLERIQLLAVYTAGFRPEAQALAIEYGCTKNYGARLYYDMCRKLYRNHTSLQQHRMLERAMMNGKI